MEGQTGKRLDVEFGKTYLLRSKKKVYVMQQINICFAAKKSICCAAKSICYAAIKYLLCRRDRGGGRSDGQKAGC